MHLILESLKHFNDQQLNKLTKCFPFAELPQSRTQSHRKLAHLRENA